MGCTPRPPAVPKAARNGSERKSVYACVLVCARLPACVRACVVHVSLCVAATVWLWGPLVSYGIIIITTTTATTPKDNLDYIATTTATPHAALVGNG